MKSEYFKDKGVEGMKAQKYEMAVGLYTEAMKFDLYNVFYRSNRPAALLSMGMGSRRCLFRYAAGSKLCRRVGATCSH